MTLPGEEVTIRCLSTESVAQGKILEKLGSKLVMSSTGRFRLDAPIQINWRGGWGLAEVQGCAAADSQFCVKATLIHVIASAD